MVNHSVSIYVSQPYNNIETQTALKRRTLRFSIGFGDLSIDLSLANAAHARPIRTDEYLINETRFLGNKQGSIFLFINLLFKLKNFQAFLKAA